MSTDQKKMVCLGCDKLTMVNPYSWKCDPCLNKSPDEKKVLKAMVEVGKTIKKFKT